MDLSPRLHKQGGRQRDYDLEHRAHRWSLPDVMKTYEDRTRRKDVLSWRSTHTNLACQLTSVTSVTGFQVLWVLSPWRNPFIVPGSGSSNAILKGGLVLHCCAIWLCSYELRPGIKIEKSKIGEWEPPICQRRLQEMMNLCVFRLPKKAPCVEGATACRQENLDSRLNLFDLGVPFALVTRIMFSSPNRSCIKPDHASILSPRYKYENFPISLCIVYQSIRCFFWEGSYWQTWVEKPLLVAPLTWSKTMRNVSYSAFTEENYIYNQNSSDKSAQK